MKRQLIRLTATPHANQFIKFAIVGCLNVLVSFVVFYLCYRQWPLASMILATIGTKGAWINANLATFGIKSIDGAFANILGYLAGMVNSFILNKMWTFAAKGATVRQINRFVILNILGLILSTLIIFIFVDLLLAPYLIVWFLTIGIVMILNFLGNKYWTFAGASQLEKSITARGDYGGM